MTRLVAARTRKCIRTVLHVQYIVITLYSQKYTVYPAEFQIHSNTLNSKYTNVGSKYTKYKVYSAHFQIH